MKTWINSTDYVSTSVVDNIIKKIKTRSVRNEDIGTLVRAMTDNFTIEKGNFQYIDISFTGSYQQKLLLTISSEDNPINSFNRNVERFCDYLKDDIRPCELELALKFESATMQFMFVACISDTVEDVFTLIE